MTIRNGRRFQVVGGECQLQRIGRRFRCILSIPVHARLLLDGRALMASDTPVGQPHPGMNGFALSLNYPAPAEARRVFDALAAGGKVTMPMQKTFWSEAYGMLTDRFGTPWMVGGGMPA